MKDLVCLCSQEWCSLCQIVSFKNECMSLQDVQYIPLFHDVPVNGCCFGGYLCVYCILMPVIRGCGEMDEWFHLTHFSVHNYLSKLGFELIHVSKRVQHWLRWATTINSVLNANSHGSSIFNKCCSVASFNAMIISIMDSVEAKGLFSNIDLCCVVHGHSAN